LEIVMQNPTTAVKKAKAAMCWPRRLVHPPNKQAKAATIQLMLSKLASSTRTQETPSRGG
jgi:hypothetical protein